MVIRLAAPNLSVAITTSVEVILTVLNMGDKAPDFTLTASTGETISLHSLAGSKVVLYFYPKDDTRGCTLEACGFRDYNSDLIASGVRVLGISADSIESHRNFAGKFDLTFPLLSNEDTEMIQEYGAWGERQRQGQTVMGVKRMTYLIDEAGNISKIWPEVVPDHHAEEVLAAVQGLD